MREKEQKLLKTLFAAVMAVVLVLSATASGFFVKGKLKERNAEMTRHEESLKASYRFTNMELLEFLTVSDIRQYREAFKASAWMDKAGAFSEVTILDSIAKSVDGASYEWLTVCNDNEASVFMNRFDKENHFFSVLPYEDEAAHLPEEEKDMVKKAVTQTSGDYIVGTLDDMDGIPPSIDGMESLTAVIGEEPAKELSERLKVFLTETSNSRREFLLEQLKDGAGNTVFLLDAAIALGKDDEIRGVYDKTENRFDFTYVD